MAEVIPSEAVEAAATALYERPHINGVGMADMRRALEAAAPYMRREANSAELAKLIEMVDEDEHWDPGPEIYTKYAAAIIKAGYCKVE